MQITSDTACIARRARALSLDNRMCIGAWIHAAVDGKGDGDSSSVNFASGLYFAYITMTTIGRVTPAKVASLPSAAGLSPRLAPAAWATSRMRRISPKASASCSWCVRRGQFPTCSRLCGASDASTQRRSSGSC